MKTNNKTAISLIVLVITILVLSILATVVIINLSNINIIDRTQNVKKASDIAVMKEVANVAYTALYLKDKDNVTAQDVVNKLKEQGYTDEQLDLIDIIKRDGEIYIKSKAIYGVRREVGSSSTAWERIADSVGLVANACLGSASYVQNDFDNIYPWSEIVSYNYDSETDEVKAIYGDSDYRTDGTNGDVLTKIPEFYYKREQKTENGKTYEYIYISEAEREGYSKSEKFSIGRYLSSFATDGNSLRSVSGANVATNKSIDEFRNLAKTAEYTLMDYRYFALQLLYLVEYADYDSQATLGRGHVGYRYSQTKQGNTYVVTDKAIISATNSNTITIPSTSAYKVGQQIDIGTGNLGQRDAQTQTYRTITEIKSYNDGTNTGKSITFDGDAIDIVAGSHGIWSCAQNTGSGDDLGMRSGYIGENRYSAVVYRGVEDFFGNAWQFVDGVNIKRTSNTGEVYISYTQPYETNKFDGNYKKIGYTIPLNTNGLVTALGYDTSNPLISFAISTATSGTSLNDYCYFYSSSSSSNFLALVGDYYCHGSNAGAFSWYIINESDTIEGNIRLHLSCRIVK